MFGINEKGETVALNITEFKPYFYIKVDDSWNKSDLTSFNSQIKNDMGTFQGNNIAVCKFIKDGRKTLYGFDAGKRHKFLFIQFKNESAMRKAKNLWYTSSKKNGIYSRSLTPDGYEFGDKSTYLYEGNIPPLLRMFHIKNISPSGWIEIIKNRKTKKLNTKTTTCTYEYILPYSNIKSLPEKETLVPYKIASFDIEASSSHGDFPLAKKDYRKLATNIVDVWNDISEHEAQCFLINIIKTAFNIEGFNIEDIDRVYPKNKVSETDIDHRINKLLKIDISKDKISIDENEDIMTDNSNITEGTLDNGGEEGFMWKKQKKFTYNKTKNILELLLDTCERDKKLAILIKILEIFPPLKGDEVTFIGTTFLRYGEKEPYLNHCLVKDTCTSLPLLKNSEIESCETEKDVLLGWQKIIKHEDPDIIIGYNIFGFDYPFMYERACECDCETQFLMLSRNNNEVCINKNWKTGKKGIEENTIFLASGQHDIKYIKMAGRIQVDLYNYLRRSYLLIKYKLDYVSGYFIGDYIKKIEHVDGKTKLYTTNLTGLENNNYINFEEEAHSVNSYKEGKKFEVFNVDEIENSFYINSVEDLDMTKKVRWGLAKDDVTPQDIFRMTNEGPDERAVIAKYCIQDCNLVHHLLRKIDVITEYVEMASLCSVPIDFVVMRGQGIKLTSYIAKKCREKETLMPDIEKGDINEGYEGAIVLDPKCDLYLKDPVACVDYSSLYPSSMISENISHDSKVWTKEYDMDNNLLKETGIKNEKGEYEYDELPEYKYVDITYDTYKWQRKNNNPKAAMEKVRIGYKTCRFAQFPEGYGIMPSILKELLAARKATRKLIPKQKDEFMKNVLDKRQLSIKVTANSMYGQTGAKTSTFYEKDCAASTTAIGRKLLTYGKRVIEESYTDRVVETSQGKVRTNAEYVYGDTDSVFFKFNLTELDGTPIVDKKALELTIELATQAGELASKFLKPPHWLEYEKTFWPWCLLSKKRYVGILYEEDPNKGKRKSMGIVLKRRDNAPIVKDVYGGVIDILMKEKNIAHAVTFVKECLQHIVDEKYGMDKLIITKSLRSGYKNPKQIAHKVLADRIGKRDSGNKPSVGDRIPFVYINNPNKKALQGDRIETPEFIIANKLKINYSFYITNQLMKPLQQVFALVLEKIPEFKKKKGHTLRTWYKELEKLKKTYPDEIQYMKKLEALRNKEVKKLIFDPFITITNNTQEHNQSLTSFYSYI
jgi:DNA polymerase elongation subunit (family B)